MREFFTIAIFKIKADIRMNKTTLNSQKEKHSTLSLRRATRYAVNQFPVTLISIHALLAESDEKRDAAMKEKLKFLSTLSLRRATTGRQSPALGVPYFYPRSPCGERLGMYMRCVLPVLISIHALLAESDNADIDGAAAILGFLSTLSLRRATFAHLASLYQCKFLSTLSLRRATCRALAVRPGPDYFYPRSPCGERPGIHHKEC